MRAGPAGPAGRSVAGDPRLLARPVVPGVSAAIGALGGVGPSLVLGGLAVTLALLPFEGVALRRFQTPGWRFTMTDVEAVAAATFGAWLLLLVGARRRPAVPTAVLASLGLLAGITLLSALLAGPTHQVGMQVTARAALAWGLLLVTVDLVRRPPAAIMLLATVLASASISAAVGWIAWWNGSAGGLFGAGRLFTVGGVERMAGTWDYPTIAAMAWTSILLGALPLLALRWGRRTGMLTATLAAVLVLLGASVLLTLTRGAFLGLAAGLLTFLLVAVGLRWRRLAVVAVVATVSLLVAGGALYARLPLPVERLLRESDRALYGAAYDVPGRVAVAPGGALELEVIVHNTGLATWTPDAPNPWQLAILWIDPETRARTSPHHVVADLPGPVAPGGSVSLRVSVPAPDAAGADDLAWDMQQSGVAEFSEREVPVAVTRVLVDAEAARRPTPMVAPERLRLYPQQLPILDRSQLWTAAIRLVEQHPWLGVGPGSFRLVHGAALGLTRWDTQIHANSLVLELAATTGILGLAAFLATVATAGWRQLRFLRVTGPRMPRPDLRGLLVVGSLGATAAALGHGLVDHFLVFAPMGILFWVLLGVGVGLTTGAEPATPGTPGSGRDA